MSMTSRIAAIMFPFSLLACSESPKANVVTPEATPLVPSVADPAVALTFAQTRDATGHIMTLLVTNLGREMIQAVDLTELGVPLDADVFDVVSRLGTTTLQEAAIRVDRRRRYRIAALLPAAGDGRRHVATGTNFREHAKEAGIDGVFNFPKFGSATSARTTVGRRPKDLLDYEVEICTRFDRDVRSVADFDAARKGFFLCGDFTDRAQLLRLVNTKDIGSGQGFSDAKSRADFFPTGPFLVIPLDWQAFVKAERITTHVNQEVRQDARGGEMILEFRAIVRKALTNGGGGRYTFRGSSVPLLPGGGIPRGTSVMSGTSAGVIFKPPGARDYFAGVARYILTGAMLRSESAQRVAIETFIEKEQRSGRYLRSGDVVIHRSSSMGDLEIRVVPARSPVVN